MVVDNINQATNVEHILPDGTRHYIPASRLEADPRNPDNLISAQTFTDEEAQLQGTEKEKSLTNQRSRSVLTRGGIYRMVYYPGVNRNSKTGGDFGFYLKEEVPFSLAYYGIYKKSEEEALTQEELDSNCLVDSLKEYPEEMEKLKFGHLNTYTILDAWNFNPICEMLKCNIEVHRVSVSERKARILKFPSRSIQCDYTKTLEICNHENHFFPFVKNTGFLMSYIKKCGWREGSNWREPTQDKHKNYFNSLNLVKQLIIQKEDYLDEKPKEEILKKESKRQKIRKLKNKDFPDYPTFSMSDSREIKPFDYKRYCPPPIMNPMDTELDLNEIEKQDYFTDQVIDDIVNCRETTKEKQQTKIEYLVTIPVKIIRKMVSLMDECGLLKVFVLKIFIKNCLEKHPELFISEDEYVEEATVRNIENDELEEECLKHFSVLYELPYCEDTGEAFFVADIETVTDLGYHEPYLICWDKLDGKGKGEAEDYGCCKKFIEHLKKQKENKITVLAHNLSYEFAHLLREVDIVSNTIEPKNNRVYKAVCYVFVNKIIKKIVFVDTLAKIPMAEAHFEKMFNLEKGKKLNFPYSFYNHNTGFLKNVKMDLELYDDISKLFDPEYLVCSRDKKLIVKSRQCALDYCRQDVETLRQGWNSMHKMVLELTGIDYNKVVTISALAHAICLKEGCYEGVTECRFKTEAFIRKCLIGGRTMVALHNKKHEGIRILNEEEGEEYQNGFNYDYENETIYPEKLENKFGFKRYGENNVFREPKIYNVVKEKEEYDENVTNSFVSPRPRVTKENYKNYQMYDECSLYPSAIVASRGIVKGFPTRISKEQAKNKSFKNIANEYFLKIKVLSVGKKYHNPMTNYLREDGKRVWTNDIEGKIIYVDRVMLEILEKYHEIKYVCYGGLMYTGGYNTKIKDVIRKFYDLRLKYKKEKNPLEIVLKLVLNNCYGTNIMREHEEKTLWVCGKRVKDSAYMYKIWDKYGIENVEGWEIKRGMLKLKIKNAFDTKHWSCAQWGCIILSESKKILADHTILIDEYIKYGDTDSFVANEEGIKMLKELRPEIFGNNLGQLKLEHHTKSSNMIIEKGIFLAPKLYLIKEVDLDNGDVYWKSAAKGVTLSTREITCRQIFNGNWLTMFYAMIYRKKGVRFDLLNGGNKIRMDFSSDNRVSTVDEFERTLGCYK